MTFTIECQHCGGTYEATTAAIRAGAWQDCPHCQADEPSDAAGGDEESGVAE